jgi:hypothetical protein
MIEQQPVPHVTVHLSEYEEMPVRGPRLPLSQLHTVEGVDLHNGSFSPNYNHHLVGQLQGRIQPRNLDSLALAAAGISAPQSDELLFGPEAAELNTPISRGRVERVARNLRTVRLGATVNAALNKGILKITQPDPEVLPLDPEGRFLDVITDVAAGKTVAQSRGLRRYDVEAIREDVCEAWQVSDTTAAVTRAHLTGLLKGPRSNY